MLSLLGVWNDFELHEHTFHRFLRHQDETEGWVCKTLDFGAAGYDPIRFAGWQFCVSIADQQHSRASDHKAVEVHFERKQQQRKPSKEARNMKPIPEWLYNDADF
eukprot:10793150-Karenia_brevis.AAC.1